MRRLLVAAAAAALCLTAPAQAAEVVVAGGDVACDPANANFNGGDGTTSPAPGFCHQRYTSDLFAALDPAHILALGDLQYEDGRIEKFHALVRPRHELGPAGGQGDHQAGAGQP